MLRPRLVCGKPRVVFQFRAVDGLAESRPEVLGVGHAQHDPPLVLGRIDIANRIAYRPALGTQGVFSGDKAGRKVESQNKERGVEKRYLHLLADAGALPDEECSQDAGKKAERGDAVSVARTGDVGGAIGFVHQVHHARTRPESHCVISAGVLVRPLLSVSGQVGIDDFRVKPGDSVIGEFEFIQFVGPQIVRKNVR